MGPVHHASSVVSSLPLLALGHLLGLGATACQPTTPTGRGGAAQENVITLERRADGQPLRQILLVEGRLTARSWESGGEAPQEFDCRALSVADFAPAPGPETLYGCGETQDRLEPLALVGGGRLLWAQELDQAVIGWRALDVVAGGGSELLLSCAGLAGYYLLLKWRDEAFVEIFSAELGGLTDLAFVPAWRTEDLLGSFAIEGRRQREAASVTLFRWEWDPAAFRYAETYRRERVEGLDPDQLTRLAAPDARQQVSRLLQAIPDDDRPTFMTFLPPEGLLLDGRTLTTAQLQDRLLEVGGLLALLQVVTEEPPEWAVQLGPAGGIRLLERTTDRVLHLDPGPAGRLVLREVAVRGRQAAPPKND